MVLNFMARFRVRNVDHEGVNIRDSKFRDARVPTKITVILYTTFSTGLYMCIIFIYYSTIYRLTILFSHFTGQDEVQAEMD